VVTLTSVPKVERLSMDAIIEFMLLPMSGSAEHFISDAHKWHARLMVVAWGIFIPTGIFIARYYKITTRQRWPLQLDNQFWWRTHLTLQIGGSVLSLAALVIVLLVAEVPEGRLESMHHLLGWSIILLAVSQIVGGALRGTKSHPTVVLDPDLHKMLNGGDHFEMSVRRRLFEYTHKIVGYSAMLLAVINIIVGLTITDAPRWMWIIIVLFWLMLLASCFRLQRAGRCVDTYQAIYGPAPELPGNGRPPIGWGIKRYRADDWPPSGLRSSRRR